MHQYDKRCALDAHDGIVEPALADAGEHREFAGPVDQEAIFQKLLWDELRAGRLTKRRRRRILQYAAQLGFSAREIGDLLDHTKQHAEVNGDRKIQRRALELIDPPEPRVPIAWMLSMIIALVLLADLTFILLLR